MFLAYKLPGVNYQLCILIRENAAFLDLVIYFVINIFGKILPCCIFSYPTEFNRKNNGQCSAWLNKYCHKYNCPVQ